MSYTKNLLFFAILPLFIMESSSKAVILSTKECSDRLEQFQKIENSMELYLKDLQNNFNNFTDEVKNIVNRAKMNVEKKIGGRTQAQYYKEFSKLKKNTKNIIRGFEFVLDEYIVSLLLMEDCDKRNSEESYSNDIR